MKKISRFVIPSLVVLILILDFLALDDITTGNQPNYWGEWDFLLFSIMFLVIIIYVDWSVIKKWTTKKLLKS